MPDKDKIQLRAYIDNAILMELAGTSSAPVNLTDKFVMDPKLVGRLVTDIAKIVAQKGMDILGFRVLPSETKSGFFPEQHAYPMIYIGMHNPQNNAVVSSVMTTVIAHPWDYVFNDEGKCIYGQDRLDDIYKLPSREIIDERMAILSRLKVASGKVPNNPNASQTHSMAED